MISFDITPFTDLPTNRIIRYFTTRESSITEEQVAVHSGLSHLWSEKRRHEEDRFAMLLADLGAIAKELDVVLVVSGTTSASATPSDLSFGMSDPQSSTQIATIMNEEECWHVDTTMPDTTMPDTMMPWPQVHSDTIGTVDSPSADSDYDAELLLLETQDAIWLNDMKAKVQTLLQDAQDVLGTPLPLAAAASTTTTTTAAAAASESLESLESFKFTDHLSTGANKHCHSDDADSDSDLDGHRTLYHSLSDGELDVISLYMHNHSNSNSFTSEGLTLLDDDGPDSGMVAPFKESDWLLGHNGDTSTDAAGNTSFSLDQFLEIESDLDLKDPGFGADSGIQIPDLDSRNIASIPSLCSITSGGTYSVA